MRVHLATAVLCEETAQLLETIDPEEYAGTCVRVPCAPFSVTQSTVVQWFIRLCATFYALSQTTTMITDGRRDVLAKLQDCLSVFDHWRKGLQGADARMFEDDSDYVPDDGACGFPAPFCAASDF